MGCFSKLSPDAEPAPNV